MKRIKVINDPDKPAFRRICYRIKRNEAMKDEFLKASRLQRHERQPMSSERFEAIMLAVYLLIGCSAFLLFISMLFGTR